MTRPHAAATPSLSAPLLGGRPYGLEPLTIPEGKLPPKARDLALPKPPRHHPDFGGTDAEELFWFRWVTGHQVTFLLWKFLAQAMTDAGVVERRADALHRAARLVRGYSGVLLYTGSCTRDVYLRLIRPSMARQHPGFSGAWAADYRAVRSVLRDRLSMRHDSASRALVIELQLNQLIHDGIATKLVPGECSLLRSFTAESRLGRPEVLRALYDCYFLVIRSPVPHHNVVAQLVRRLEAVGSDLATNGLHPPFASRESAKCRALRDPAVLECERDLPDLINDTIVQCSQY